MSENFLPVMPEIDGDIDRSEFDKYLSGYGANHATSVSCSFYGGGVGGGAAGSSSASGPDGPSSVFVVDGSKEDNGGGGQTNYVLMKSEPLFETIPAAACSSLSSALADVRSVYYDC